jgi:lipid-binding SYLF domain-containing protein
MMAEIQKVGLLLTLLLMLVTLVACSSKVINKESLNDSDYLGAVNATKFFQADKRLAEYFDDAVAYAMFPRVYRAGAGYGVAYGSGWVFRDGSFPIGKISTWQFSAGPHVGAQYYEQILFFKTERALSLFQKGTLEFGGQANVTVLAAGVSATPSYNEDVAVFTNVRGGLMLEGSIGGHRYNYQPIQ